MGRVRVGMVVAIAALAATAGCVPPEESTPPVANPAPVAPTAPVGADGQPLDNLCDLLTAAEFAEITSTDASEPETAAATETSATCQYGENASRVAKNPACGPP